MYLFLFWLRDVVVLDFLVVLIGVLFLVEDSKDLRFGVVVAGIMFGRVFYIGVINNVNCIFFFLIFFKILFMILKGGNK